MPACQRSPPIIRSAVTGILLTTKVNHTRQKRIRALPDKVTLSNLYADQAAAIRALARGRTA